MLAGVNGAGKSSVLGSHLISHHGIPWFNPDTFARELVSSGFCEQTEANAFAWHEGMSRLDRALRDGKDYAFETTLGGNTVPARIRDAALTHDVFVWYCGMDRPEKHLERIRARVDRGGHDIPEDKVRERFERAPRNLIALMPILSGLQVFDNSVDAGPSGIIPDPVWVLSVVDGDMIFPNPNDPQELGKTPAWARAIVELAVRLWSD